jgi:hypothetical protein
MIDNAITYREPVTLINKNIDKPIRSEENVIAFTSTLQDIFAKNITLAQTSCTNLKAEENVIAFTSTLQDISAKNITLTQTSCTNLKAEENVIAFTSTLQDISAKNITLAETSCTNLKAEEDVSAFHCKEIGTIESKTVSLKESNARGIVADKITAIGSQVTGEVDFKTAFIKHTVVVGTLHSSQFNSLKIKGVSEVDVIRIEKHKSVSKPLLDDSRKNFSRETGRGSNIVRVSMAGSTTTNSVIAVSGGSIHMSNLSLKPSPTNATHIVRELKRDEKNIGPEKEKKEIPMVKINMKSWVKVVIFEGGIKGIVSLPEGYDNRHNITVINGEKQYRTNRLNKNP